MVRSCGCAPAGSHGCCGVARLNQDIGIRPEAQEAAGVDQRLRIRVVPVFVRIGDYTHDPGGAVSLRSLLNRMANRIPPEK